MDRRSKLKRPEKFHSKSFSNSFKNRITQSKSSASASLKGERDESRNRILAEKRGIVAEDNKENKVAAFEERFNEYLHKKRQKIEEAKHEFQKHPPFYVGNATKQSKIPVYNQQGFPRRRSCKISETFDNSSTSLLSFSTSCLEKPVDLVQSDKFHAEIQKIDDTNIQMIEKTAKSPDRIVSCDDGFDQSSPVDRNSESPVLPHTKIETSSTPCASQGVQSLGLSPERLNALEPPTQDFENQPELTTGQISPNQQSCNTPLRRSSRMTRYTGNFPLSCSLTRKSRRSSTLRRRRCSVIADNDDINIQQNHHIENSVDTLVANEASEIIADVRPLDESWPFSDDLLIQKPDSSHEDSFKENMPPSSPIGFEINPVDLDESIESFETPSFLDNSQSSAKSSRCRRKTMTPAELDIDLVKPPEVYFDPSLIQQTPGSILRSKFKRTITSAQKSVRFNFGDPFSPNSFLTAVKSTEETMILKSQQDPSLTFKQESLENNPISPFLNLRRSICPVQENLMDFS